MYIAYKLRNIRVKLSINKVLKCVRRHFALFFCIIYAQYVYECNYRKKSGKRCASNFWQFSLEIKKRGRNGGVEP